MSSDAPAVDSCSANALAAAASSAYNNHSVPVSSAHVHKHATTSRASATYKALSLLLFLGNEEGADAQVFRDLVDRDSDPQKILKSA